MNDTPLAIDPTVATLKKEFLDKFEIPDFVAYSIDNKAVSYVIEYRINYEGFKNATQQADNPSAEVINFVTNEVGEVETFLKDTEKPEEYLSLIEEIETLKSILENNPSLPKEKLDQTTKELEEKTQKFSEKRMELFFKELEATTNAKKLFATPKLAAIAMKMMNNDNAPKEYKEIDPDGKETALKNKIVELFFAGHDKTKEEILKIKKKMTVRRFNILCLGICEEPENGLDESISTFFAKTLSTQN
jgi:uncharacterized tellurite resistance protein B-like protein